MNDLKIYAGGKIDFLSSLKETYAELKSKLKTNKNITEKERSEKLKERFS
jgi:hypothetical protein